MKTYRLVCLFLVDIILSYCCSACTTETEEFFVQDGSICLRSEIVSTSRVTDQSLQSTQIAEGQQVGVTITGAVSDHENIAWVVGKNGSLSNTGSAVYWGTTNTTITAYHPYYSNCTGTNHTFTVNTDQSTNEGYLNSDLLWAITTVSAATNPVSLSFTHKLSKINVTLVNKGNENLNNATITLCGVNIATGFNPQTGELYGVTENIADIKASVTTESAYTASAIIVPQTLAQGTKFIKITFEDKDYHYTLPEDQVFESGQAYQFTIEINISDNSNAKTDYVDLKFGMSGVSTSYNGADGSLTMTYPSGSMPSVKEGKAIVLPAAYGFDIRVIESFSTSGNTLSMKTSKGNMGNLFRNTNFTLTTDADVASRSVGSNVYTPVAYGYVDENGTYHEVFNESRAIYPVEQFNWEFKKDYNGEILYEGKAGTLKWDKCEFSTGLKGTFTFDFGEKTINEVRAVGDLKRMNYKLTGNVDIDMLLHYKYKYEYEESGDEIIEYNAIPMIQMTFRPIIAGVPVPIHLQIYTHLGKMYACQIEGELDATAGVKMGNEISVGLEWTSEGGAKPIKEAKPYFEFYPLTVEAQASAEAKVSYYPQWEIGIYGFKAIWLEPRPYLKEKVEAGFRASTDGENYIGWKAETYNGMDLRMGLETEFGFWRKDVWTSDIYNVMKDRLLFEAPSRITTLSPENNIVVEEDESVTAEFLVESFSPITNKYYPCPWALINLEPECGELDKPLTITDLEGKAMVDWTPSPSVESRSSELVERTLTAKVVDKEGGSIDESTLVVKTEDEDDLREALIKLYQSTNGDNWFQNFMWCSDAPVTEWDGISKISDDEYKIELSNNNLIGVIDQTFPNNIKLELRVSGNQLTSLNVSGCTALVKLECEYNHLTSLNVSSCTSLKSLFFNDNSHLTSLNVFGCTALENMECYNTHLTSLNVSSCTSLKSLFFNDNSQLTTLNVSDCTSLEELEFFGDNQLISLNASGCTSLKKLEFGDNSQLTTLDVSGCTSLKFLYFHGSNHLTSLNIFGCTALEELVCSNTQLTSLNASGCTSLEYLYFYDNSQLTTLNASGCTSLEDLDCSNVSQLTTLDVSGCTLLKYLHHLDNNSKLTFLNVSDCTSLEDLDCSNVSQLTTLDVSGCTSLRFLYFYDNSQLTTLDILGCTSLESLSFNGNSQMPTLDVSGCKSLKSLSFNETSQFTFLNVSSCTSLESLSFTGNSQVTTLKASDCTSLVQLSIDSSSQMTSLNVSGCTSLVNLGYANNSQMTSLNASGCTSLKSLDYCYNTQLTSLDVSGCTSLENLGHLDSNYYLISLNISGCTSLKSLDCYYTQLTSLNASGCTALRFLDCSHNQLTSLIVSGCTLLEKLSCNNNHMTSLNVSSCTSLKQLNCFYNQLTSLNVSACTGLERLACFNNQLTSLNVSGCTSLTFLRCQDNIINSVIPEWFSQLSTFTYDRKYNYPSKKIDGEWIIVPEDNGYGWWYPGEPEKGYHRPN